MRYDWTQINRSLASMASHIAAISDSSPVPLDANELQDHIHNLKRELETLRALLMVLSAQMIGVPQSAQPSDDPVTVTVRGQERTFTKFDRHMLYCTKEYMRPSIKNYSLQGIFDAYARLCAEGYMYKQDHAPRFYVLTELGHETVSALRQRPR